MLIDELLECEGRVKAAEAVIGDFQRYIKFKPLINSIYSII